MTNESGATSPSLVPVLRTPSRHSSHSVPILHERHGNPTRRLLHDVHDTGQEAAGARPACAVRGAGDRERDIRGHRAKDPKAAIVARLALSRGRRRHLGPGPVYPDRPRPPTTMHNGYPGRRSAALLSTLAVVSCSPIRVPPPPAVPQSAIGHTLSRDDALADVDVLFRMLEDVHPDLYRNRPRDSVTADRARLMAALPSTISRADLWIRLAPIVAWFGDGHTSVEMPREEARRMQVDGALVFEMCIALFLD